MKSYVYLICDSAQNLFKIGNGTELHIVNYHETYYPYRIEQLLHNHFHLKREHGEWFRLTIEDIISFKPLCERFEHLIEVMKDNPFFSKNLH